MVELILESAAGIRGCTQQFIIYKKRVLKVDRKSLVEFLKAHMKRNF